MWKIEKYKNIFENISENKYVKDKYVKYCKVRVDNCHYTEEYWGAAHSISNLKYILPKKFP